MTTTLEFMIPRDESEAFNTAVYRFLELRRGGVDAEISMLTSEPHGPVTRKTLTLADDQELRDFTRFWADERRSLRGAPRPVWLARAAGHGAGGEIPV